MKKLLALLLSAAIISQSIMLNAFAEAPQEETPAASEEEVLPEKEERIINLPRDMRAAVITPGVDFFTNPEDGAEAISAELEEIYAEFGKIGLNTVIINTVYEDCSYYNLDMNDIGAAADPTAIAIETAYNHGVSPYAVYDIGHALSDCADSSTMIDVLISKTHRFALKYHCDGVILDDYYLRRSLETYGGYMDNGSGIGYGNWLYDTAEQYFSTAAEIVRMTDNTLTVGFMINDMWANSASNEAGSNTSDEFQALYDGNADTKSFIEKGYVDFAVLRAYGSLSSVQLPFEEVTGWWGSLTSEKDMPIYIVHHNERIGTDGPGWSAEDQLLRQLTVAKKLDSYGGSVFNSFESLKNNPLGTTTTLTSYFNEQVDESSLFEDLKMTSPAKLSFTTSEQSVTFMGSFDSNFPVYFNDKEIPLNDAGNFYFTKDLKVGMNTFTIKHKSKTLTYKIERKIVVMTGISKSISEDKTLYVDGGTKIKLSVTAYKGSNVYGTVNGQTVPMTEATVTGDEDDVNSSYVRYTGTYTAPEGLIRQEQNLGAIHIYGSNSGFSAEVIGAKVVVNAEPEPVVEQESVMLDSSSVGSGEIIGTLESRYKATDSVKYVKVGSDFTIVYDGKTADDIPSPIFSQLPAGTIEPYKSTSGNYYVTESGKRIAASACTLTDGYGIESNPLFVKSIGTSDGKSYIKINMPNKTGFNMRLAGNSYYTAWDGDYNVNSFTATHLYITFEDVTSVTKLPSFENNLVFKSGKWDTVTEDNGKKFRLILELRQPGVYFGHSAVYNGEGDLVLSFPVPTNLLSGLTIVIDPGHGYGKFADKFDPGAIGEVRESDVVLPIAKELTSQLQAAGANVIRLKSESQFLLTRERPIYARGYGCDIYLSIHANKAWGASSGVARGTEVYYFTSYSQPLAASISSKLSSYFSSSVYSDGADKNRGAKYSYFQVTLQQDFPSVLIETGFVDNIEDAMALNSVKHQKGIAKAIVDGLKAYISRSSISYAAEGSESAEKPSDNTEETEPEETEPEETEVQETEPEETTTEVTDEPEETEPEETAVPPTDTTTELPEISGGWMDTEAPTTEPPSGGWMDGGIPAA